MVILMGIDPGLKITGYGLIEEVDNKIHYVASGCIRIQKAPLPERLQQIYNDISIISERYSPQSVGIEQVFVSKNADSALKLGQAKAAAIVAVVNQSIEMVEYSARKVKKSVVGKGSADKLQVQHMVKSILELSDMPQADAADALAVALCHFYSRANLIRRDYSKCLI